MNGSRYTDAIVSRMPVQPVFAQGTLTTSVDVHLARQQQEQLYEVLRECGLQITELQPEESAPISHDFLADLAIVINNTALITRPPDRSESRTAEIRSLLPTMVWEIYEVPEREAGVPVVLSGSDVLYTGREIFVGVHRPATGKKGGNKQPTGTNMEGAMQVARTFPDVPTIPISIDSNEPLKHFVCLAATDVLSIGTCKTAKHILQRIERESSYRYQTLTIDKPAAINCLHANGYTIYRSDFPEAIEKFVQLSTSCHVIGIDCGELMKMGGSLSQYVLLARKWKSVKNMLA